MNFCCHTKVQHTSKHVEKSVLKKKLITRLYTALTQIFVCPFAESMPTSTASVRGLGTGSAVTGVGGGGGSTAGSGGPAATSEQLPILEMRELGKPHSSQIPPFSFWNSEFRNKQAAFIRFNFTMPWGANFAVYGRRNVAPSVTQYDFVEFVKGGRVARLKRSLVDDAETPAVTFTTLKWHMAVIGKYSVNYFCS
jgi:hypothetical protein